MKSLILLLLVSLFASCSKVKTNVYVAKLTQVGTENPTAKVINDKKIQVEWSRSAVGVFKGEINGAEIDNISVQLSNPANPKDAVSYSLSENSIVIYSSSFSQSDNYNVLSDGIMINLDIVLTEYR